MGFIPVWTQVSAELKQYLLLNWLWPGLAGERKEGLMLASKYKLQESTHLGVAYW